MKQLGAPQLVMYTKEPGASREVIAISINIFILLLIIIGIITIGMNSLFLLPINILPIIIILCRCDCGRSCGEVAEENYRCHSIFIIIVIISLA